MHKRGLCCHAVSVCLSVRPSVCPSVTFVDHVKTNKHIFEIFSPSDSDTILVFPYQRGADIPTGTPLTGALNARGGMKNPAFRPLFSSISRSISETVIVRWTQAGCSEAICKHRILFPSIQHLAWLPQGKQKCELRYVKTAIFCTCSSNNWETVEDRWVHAARGLASTELSFHSCNVLRDCHRCVPRANKKWRPWYVKMAIFCNCGSNNLETVVDRRVHAARRFYRATLCKRGLCCRAVSVCLSVRLSRSWIMSKRTNISWIFFHHRVATPF